MTRAEALEMVDRLDDKGRRMLYAYLLALRTGDAETLEAIEAARAEDNTEKVENICEQYLARRQIST